MKNRSLSIVALSFAPVAEVELAHGRTHTHTHEGFHVLATTGDLMKITRYHFLFLLFAAQERCGE